MAQKPLQGIEFPGLPDEYMTPVVDSTLMQTGAAADAKKTGDEIAELKNDLNQKADKTEALSAYIVETETGSIASFTDGADGVPVKDLTVAIEPVQSGSGDPSPENIRPISGWTGANVTVNGINQFNKNTVVDGFIDESTGALNPLNTYKSTDYIKVIAGASYYVKSEQTGGMWGAWYDKNKTYIRGETQYANKAITAPNNAEYVRFTVATSQTGNVDTFAVNYPSTDTDYHAYNGSSVSVDWTTEAGTVYGGTLDVTSGVLTVDRAYYTVDETSPIFLWATPVSPWYGFAITLSPAITSSRVTVVCDKAKSSLSTDIATSWNAYAVNGILYTCIDESVLSERSINAVKEWLSSNPLHYVCPLATPQTYQLTPQEVSTLLGQNNIFADTGNVTVQYRADTKLYIDKVVNA